MLNNDITLMKNFGISDNAGSVVLTGVATGFTLPLQDQPVRFPQDPSMDQMIQQIITLTSDNYSLNC